MVRVTAVGIKELENKYMNFHDHNARALVNAMNKAGAIAETASLALARSKWNLRARDLKEKTHRKKANIKDHTYVFEIKSRSINLEKFYAKEINTGVSYKIQKKRNKLKGNYFMGAGYVFMRKSDDRKDIMPMFSISPSHMFRQAKAEEKFIEVFKYGKTGEIGFNKTYIAQLKRFLEKST